MPPAARITDMHTCPMATPGTPPVPHVGGPVITGAPTVIVAGMPQARISDQCTCVGPPDVIVKGSPTVIVAGMPAARLGDMTAHGGVITTGAPNVLIGEAGAGAAPPPVKGMTEIEAHAAIGQALEDATTALDTRIGDLDNWDDETAKSFKQWFGTDDKAARAKVRARMEAIRDLLESYALDNFKPDDDSYAYVYPDDDQTMYLGEGFKDAPETGRDSRAGTLIHEASHFDSIAGTDDHAYGEAECEKLAKEGSDGLDNADSFEYFVEDGM